MSLRNRVLFGFLAIAIVLVAADVALATNLQRSLLDQVDRRLQNAPGPFLRQDFGAPADSPSGGGRPTASPPSFPTESGAGGAVTVQGGFSARLTEYYVEVLGPDGSQVHEYTPTLRDGDPRPKIDGKVALAHAVMLGDQVRPFTVGSDDGSGLRYRMIVVHDGSGQYTVIGTSLREADATFSRLILVEIIATGAVLLVLGLVAFWVIRLGVRPIDKMAATADAIAAGDLSRRVEEAPPGTEAGRLSVALNGMLHQIEGAFAERHASEDRLRRFVADASHELRTPLTSIRGYTELYRSGAISEGAPLADAMRRIEGESVRMGGLVDDMLLLARLDQGRPLASDPIDLAALAADAVADARAVEPDRPITLDAPNPVMVTGDEQRLRQVVTNLVANTREHTPSGAAVDVRVWTIDGRALLEVADHGPGIAAEDREHVFERFYRADPSRVRGATQLADASGSGLGLAIVAAVAAAHGGRASLESSDARGTRFRVELPAVGEAAQPPGGAAAPVTPG